MSGRTLIGFAVGLLQAQVLDALHFVERIVAAVARDGTVFNSPSRLHGTIEKLSVVADDDDSAGQTLEPGFKPDETVDVQVVGGFVQKQQLCRVNETTSQSQAIAPAAREFTHGTVFIPGQKAQTVHDRKRLRLYSAFVDFRQMCGGRSNAHVVAAFVCGELLSLGRHERSVAFKHVLQRFAIGLFHALRDFGNQFRHVDGARFRTQFAQNGGKKRRFAASVLTDERNALAVGGDQIDVVVQRTRAAHNRKVLESEHGNNFRARESRALTNIGKVSAYRC